MADVLAQERKKMHLRMGLIWLVLWTVVAYFMIGEFLALNGVEGAVEKVKTGSYIMPALLVSSVVLLALAIRSLSLYFSPKRDAE
jgi:ABC-type transport system involved in multi-copper enzyme maturation permease subunit